MQNGAGLSNRPARVRVGEIDAVESAVRPGDLLPPCVVLRIVAPPPTMVPVSASAKDMAFNASIVPLGRSDQVSPPSVVLRIVPLAPPRFRYWRSCRTRPGARKPSRWPDVTM